MKSSPWFSKLPVVNRCTANCKFAHSWIENQSWMYWMILQRKYVLFTKTEK